MVFHTDDAELITGQTAVILYIIRLLPPMASRGMAGEERPPVQPPLSAEHPPLSVRSHFRVFSARLRFRLSAGRDVDLFSAAKSLMFRYVCYRRRCCAKDTALP